MDWFVQPLADSNSIGHILLVYSSLLGVDREGIVSSSSGVVSVGLVPLIRCAPCQGYPYVYLRLPVRQVRM